MTAPESRDARSGVEVKFWSRVDRRGDDECWTWQGSTFRGGYGRFHVRKKEVMQAHRWSWQNAHGQEIPEGMFVLHSCDNPPCVNPAHLRLGDHAENMRDRAQRKRSRNAQRTHCDHGHEFTPENTYLSAEGWRTCRTCNLARQAQRRAARGAGTAFADRLSCPHGHAYDEINTYIDKNGGRHCRTCHRQRQAQYRSERKSA